ncbi:MAG: hypothetical protein ACLFST_00100 [Spirochaetia bacterium]
MKDVCRKNQKILQRAMDRRESPPETYIRHSENCRNCRRLLKGMNVLTEGLRQAAGRTIPEDSVPEFSESALQDTGKTARKAVFRVAAAAAFLTAAFTGVILLSGPSPDKLTVETTAGNNMLVEEEIAASVDSILSSTFAHDLSYSVASELIND